MCIILLYFSNQGTCGPWTLGWGAWRDFTKNNFGHFLKIWNLHPHPHVFTHTCTEAHRTFSHTAYSLLCGDYWTCWVQTSTFLSLPYPKSTLSIHYSFIPLLGISFFPWINHVLIVLSLLVFLFFFFLLVNLMCPCVLILNANRTMYTPS